MRNRMQNRLKRLPFSAVFYAVWTAIIAIVCFIVPQTRWRIVLALVWLLVLLCAACRPKSTLHTLSAVPTTWQKAVGTVLAIVLTIAGCVLPMDKLSLWNGEDPGHRNQYELMAESILNGHVYIAYGDEDALAQLDNPYDPEQRQEADVPYHWDHAYYNGHYYMYFGVVPVFLAFLPYRLLTGQPLTTFHATQLFVGWIVIGIFALFYLLTKRFFKDLPYAVYLALSVAFSVMSVWYSVAEPALYCTAITAAIALEIWSLFFFVKAVWGTDKENKQIAYAAIGALLGALVFGCRPPIALANLLVIPMLVVFVRQRKFTAAVLGKLLLAALPYVVVAAALMTYNDVRFDNPFEFGQTYQLTVADQSQYGFSLNADMCIRMFNETVENFFGFSAVSKEFPFLSCGGVFFNFPVLLLTAVLFKASVRKHLKENRLILLTVGLPITILIITLMDVMWTPYLLERYRMDIYFLAAVWCFICIGAWHNTGSPKQRAAIDTAAILLAVITVLSGFLFYTRTVGAYYPEVVDKTAQLLFS